MLNVRHNTENERNWRQPLAMGLAIGIAVPVGRAMQTNLMPEWGLATALLGSALAAGIVGGLVGWVTMLIFRRS